MVESNVEDTKFKKLLASPTELKREEAVSASENLLERSILVHGFCGNIDLNNSYLEETRALKSVLINGELVSPSLRNLNEKEISRYRDAPFDQNRVTFHVWKGDGQDLKAYIDSALFASPVSGLEGYVPSEDPAWLGRAISAYGRDGVRLPLERGRLFLSPERVREFRNQFEALAQKAGLNYTDYMNRQVVIIPQAVFNDQASLWSVVASRIRPATGVTAQIASVRNSLKLDFTTSLNDIQPATADELGLSSIDSNSAIDRQLFEHLEHSWQAELDWLAEIEENMQSDPFHIERLRDETSPFEDIQQLFDELDPDNPQTERMRLLEKQYEDRRRQVLAINEGVLEDKYANAPIQNTKPGQPRQKVSRGKDGKLHIDNYFLL